MGLGPSVLELYRQLKILGAFGCLRDVMELGSQDFWCPQQNLVRALCSAFDRPEPPPELLLTTNTNQRPARLLYEALGLNYHCVDVDGRAGALALDLNFDAAPAEHVGRYDLVTNHGTSEHLLNQYNVFKLMHDFAKPGGIIIHAVPFTVHLEHGFFNYQPNFFECLARYNSYEILGLWVGPDWQLPSFVPWNPALLDFLTLSSKTTHLLVAALRKLYPVEFCVPFQEQYEAMVPDAALARYAVTVDGELASGARIKHLTKNESLVKQYAAEIQGLKMSLAACRKQIDALQREVSDILQSGGDKRQIQHVMTELAKIKVEVNTAPLVRHPLQPDVQEFAYEGRGQTGSVIPEAPQQATRDRGGAILRISPRREGGLTRLHFRLLINCHASEPNSAVIAVFQDGVEPPLAVLSEPLMGNEMVLVEKEFVAEVAPDAAPPVFEVRVGLARGGGVLSLNHDPEQNIAASTPSCVRLRWLAGEG
jgi:SAM-dependent methyltransferase